jgi:hypothetical protein
MEETTNQIAGLLLILSKAVDDEPDLSFAYCHAAELVLEHERFPAEAATPEAVEAATLELKSHLMARKDRR